jgi:Fic family protein
VVDERKNKVVYIGPDAKLVPILMKELFKYLNHKEQTPVIVKAAMAHLNLTMIHPFSDGNGRMARALQTLVLAREGILSPTFSSIEEYLGRNQDDYYDVLAEVGKGSWHPENDCRAWIRFCLKAHYRGATDLLRRTRELQVLWDEVELVRKKAGLPERVEATLVMAAMGRRIRNSIYRKSAEVSEQIASRDLKKLTDAGLLVPQGERRGRIYAGSERLLAIRQGLREVQVAEDPFILSPAEPEQAELPGI